MEYLFRMHASSKPIILHFFLRFYAALGEAKNVAKVNITVVKKKMKQEN